MCVCKGWSKRGQRLLESPLKDDLGPGEGWFGM